MESLDKRFQSAVNDGKIPGAVLLAQDIHGKVNFAKCYGCRTVRGDPSSRPPMALDTIMRFASATKLLTAVMAMQCVERGLLDLGDVSIKEHLPELAHVKLITGFDESGNPQLREPEGSVTLRQLLTHSSGLPYALTIPNLRKYQEWRGCPAEGNGGDTMEENFLYPLTYDPGTGWGYGPNLDWTGRLIERVTNMSLEKYMQENLCKPLAIEDMTFKLQKRPDLIERLSDMTLRNKETGKLEFEDLKYFHHDPKDCFGGQGVWTSPQSYFKVVRSLLHNDARLLKPATCDLLFEPCLTPSSEKMLYEQCFTYRDWCLAGPVAAETRKSYGLGGLVTLEDCDGKSWRRKGNLSWSGLPCIVWNIDRETGLCTLSAFHMKPWGDKVAFELGCLFERAMIAQTGL